MPSILGEDERTLGSHWKQRNTNASLCFCVSSVYKTNSVSKSDPPTNQSGISRALSHFLDNFCQVCKFKAIRLGLCSTPHILSLNKIIHDSVIWGLNETALSYCSCKSTRSLLAYAALVLNTLALTTWMKLISQMLEENSNQNVSLFNQQIRIS